MCIFGLWEENEKWINMKIAVTYDNGEVFQHFGHTEQFKVYEVEAGKVVNIEVVAANGAGHEYIRGELTSAGVNCDHHDQGHDEDGCGCSGGCSGCSGGCGAPRIILEGKNAGKTCKVHYTGTFNDGSKFDSSYDRGEPLEFISGTGMMLRGFDAAVVNMEVGEILDIHLMPEEAYGMPDPSAVLTFEIEQLAGSENLEVGQQVYLYNEMGQPFLVKVVAKDDAIITLDMNHEMAGKELNFKIELVEVQ